MFPILQGSTTLAPKQQVGELSSSPLIYGETAAATVAASSSQIHEAGGGVGRMIFSIPSCLFLCGGSDSSTFLHILPQTSVDRF